MFIKKQHSLPVPHYIYFPNAICAKLHISVITEFNLFSVKQYGTNTLLFTVSFVHLVKMFRNITIVVKVNQCPQLLPLHFCCIRIFGPVSTIMLVSSQVDNFNVEISVPVIQPYRRRDLFVSDGNLQTYNQHQDFAL